jgi:hypothetical protein
MIASQCLGGRRRRRRRWPYAIGAEEKVWRCNGRYVRWSGHISNKSGLVLVPKLTLLLLVLPLDCSMSSTSFCFSCVFFRAPHAANVAVAVAIAVVVVVVIIVVAITVV